jgi:hypothetical protein
MRKIIIILIVFLSTPSLFSQPYNYPVLTFTSGHVDKNPTFASSSRTDYRLFNFEFLAFERHTGEFSNIGILKVDKDGVVGSPEFLTSGNSKNINPAIAYHFEINWWNSDVKNALAVWQTFENDVWNLYGCSYFDSSGWGNKFYIDSTGGIDKKNPVIIEADQENIFYVFYESNGDIIFKEISIMNNTFLQDINLTSSDTAYCQNPLSGGELYSPAIHLNYERRKSDNNFSIMKRSYNNDSWSQADTVASIGNNSVSFIYDFNALYYIFESDRTGVKKLFYLQWSNQQLVYNQNPGAEYNSFVSYIYPIITENNSPGITSFLNGFLQRSDSLKLIFGVQNYYDSLTISDNSNPTSLKMNRGIVVPGLSAKIWLTFTKDSLDFSNIYAKPFLIIIGDIKNISNVTPDRYELFQNYPNPFNPSTKIRFNVPENNFVKLDLFDMTGKLIRSLYSNYTSAGEYEYVLNGSDLSSGTYFYKLTSGRYSQTKKLVLLK